MSHYYLITTQTNFMCETLRRAWVPKLKKKITVGKDPVMVTATSMIFQYNFEGHPKHYELKLPDAAEVLYDRGLISNYEGKDNNVKIYKKTLHTFTLRDGAPVQMIDESEVSFDKLELFNSDVVDVVANWEYKLMGRFLGLIDYKPQGKIRKMSVRSDDFHPVPGQSKVIDFNNQKVA
jgi:hypothetical protein